MVLFVHADWLCWRWLAEKSQNCTSKLQFLTILWYIQTEENWFFQFQCSSYIYQNRFTLMLVKVMEIYLYIWWITVNDWVDHRFVSYLKSILCKAFETVIFNWMSKEIKYWTRLVRLVSIGWCNSFYYWGLKQSTEECPVRMEDYWSTFGNCRVTNLTV